MFHFAFRPRPGKGVLRYAAIHLAPIRLSVPLGGPD